MVNSPNSDRNGFQNILVQQESPLEQSNVENHRTSSNAEDSSIFESASSYAMWPTFLQNSDLFPFDEVSNSTVPQANQQFYATHTSMNQNGYYNFIIDSEGYMDSIQFSNITAIDVHSCNQIFPIYDGTNFIPEEQTQLYLASVIIEVPGFYQFFVDAWGKILSIHFWSIDSTTSSMCNRYEFRASLRADLERISSRISPASRSVNHTRIAYRHYTFYDENYTNGHYVSSINPLPIAPGEQLSSTTGQIGNRNLRLNSIININSSPQSPRCAVPLYSLAQLMRFHPRESHRDSFGHLRRFHPYEINQESLAIQPHSRSIMNSTGNRFNRQQNVRRPLNAWDVYSDTPLWDVNKFTSLKFYSEKGNNEMCTVCIEHLQEGKIIRHLPCGHNFHSNCIKLWFKRTKLCPNCRSDITLLKK